MNVQRSARFATSRELSAIKPTLGLQQGSFFIPRKQVKLDGVVRGRTCRESLPLKAPATRLVAQPAGQPAGDEVVALEHLPQRIPAVLQLAHGLR